MGRVRLHCRRLLADTAWRSVSAWTVGSQFPSQDREQHHLHVWTYHVRHQDFDIARDDHEIVRQVPRVAELLAADSPLGQPTGNPRVDAQPLLAVFHAQGELEAIARFRLLEGLLNVEHNDVVLAAPSWADFTLDFDDLLARLVACEGRPVGPLDLVQALHRLRPVDPARLAELMGSTSRRHPSSPLPTAPSRGTRSSSSAPGCRAGASRQSTRALSTVCGPLRQPHPCRSGRAEVPARVSSVAETPHVAAADLARVFPTWSDRAVRNAFVEGSRHGTTTACFPAHATGTFGAPLHDLFLHDLSRATVKGDRNDDRLLGAHCALGHQRFDPALIAEVGLQRHRAGTLDLPHLLETTQALGEQQLVKQLWPLLTALASGLAAEPKRPPALAGLFRQLSGWVVGIPNGSSCRTGSATSPMHAGRPRPTRPPGRWSRQWSRRERRLQGRLDSDRTRGRVDARTRHRARGHPATDWSTTRRSSAASRTAPTSSPRVSSPSPMSPARATPTSA